MKVIMSSNITLESKFICLILDYIDYHDYEGYRILLVDENKMLMTAAKYNCIHIMKFFINVNNEASVLQRRGWLEAKAAEYGSLDFIKVISQHYHSGETIHSDTMSCASQYGHLNIIQWAHANDIFCDKEEVVHLAARYNHIHILEWSYNNWDTLQECYVESGIFNRASESSILWLRNKEIINDDLMHRMLDVKRRNKDLFLFKNI